MEEDKLEEADDAVKSRREKEYEDEDTEKEEEDEDTEKEEDGG